jgi:AcrR family transcriptional regulator
MGIREEQKEQRERMSRTLIRAALELSAAQGYGSLSLRSVARKAGIAPTSFYRHFRDMDELGLAVVDQALEVLVPCMDNARKAFNLPQTPPHSPNDESTMLDRMIRSWLGTLLDCLYEHREPLRLFFQERTGSSSALRKAISAGVSRLTRTLTEDLERLGGQAGIRFHDAESTAEAVMTLVCSAALDEFVSGTHEKKDLPDRLARKLGFLLLGSARRG